MTGIKWKRMLAALCCAFIAISGGCANPSTRISEAMVWAFCLAVSAPLVPIPEHRPDICRTHRTHQPVDAPAFLVAGQYERYFGIALGVGQHFTYLLPAFQVGTAVYQAAHRHINKRLPCGFSGRCYTGNAGEQFRAENQHLAYLTAQRHPCQNIVYTAPGDRGPAALRRLALTFRNA